MKIKNLLYKLDFALLIVINYDVLLQFGKKKCHNASFLQYVNVANLNLIVFCLQKHYLATTTTLQMQTSANMLLLYSM